jgi:hypothetical protein
VSLCVHLLDGEARGQFDDVFAVQLARARFAVLQIQAAEKSIQAPIAIPQDVQELALGPDSIMRSANPQAYSSCSTRTYQLESLLSPVFLSVNYVWVLVIQSLAQVRLMPLSLLVAVFKHYRLALIHRSKQHKHSLLDMF